MCGLTAYVGIDTESGKQFIARANRVLAHRGPDDEGIWAGEGVVLGSRRLAIVDLSAAGHQPMVSPDGRFVLAYNGEVYNHMELRSRLCKSWSFRGRSDTETMLAALALNGPCVFDEMVGMWALALWDTHERRLLISRDRYGQKPLYWRRRDDGSLTLASEIRPLLGESERPEVYPLALAEYLATGNYGHLGERTFFRDIRAFPPAHWAWFSPGDPQPVKRRYWQFPIVGLPDRRPYDETAKRLFRDALEAAVESQLMSDVPLGATLSGGLDSSAIVGAIASRSGNSIPVFTAQTSGSTFDESRYVRAVEKKWNGRLDIHWVRLDSMPISSFLTKAIQHQEEPFGDPSIAAHGLLMDAARQANVPVVLGGQGGDELLFGYDTMRDSLLASTLRGGQALWALEQARDLHLRLGSVVRVGFAALIPALELRARARSRLRRRGWLTGALKEAREADFPNLARPADLRALWLEIIERSSLPHLTHYDDRNSMARSIEGRMPFLDHRLAQVVASLDERAFLNGGLLKRILRDTCSDLLPESVLGRRDKIGFFTPLRDMLRVEREWVRKQVSDEFARSLNLYDVSKIGSLVDVGSDPRSRISAGLSVWRALSVRTWAEAFNIAPLT